MARLLPYRWRCAPGWITLLPPAQLVRERVQAVVPATGGTCSALSGVHMICALGTHIVTCHPRAGAVQGYCATAMGAHARVDVCPGLWRNPPGLTLTRVDTCLRTGGVGTPAHVDTVTAACRSCCVKLEWR